MEEKLNAAFDKLDELLEVHKDFPMTTNSLFMSDSRHSRDDRSRKTLQEALTKGSLQPTQAISIDDISRLLAKMTPQKDMDMVAAEEAFDNMNAYYEV